MTWINHTGSKRPVAADQFVQVAGADGTLYGRAGDFDWDMTEDPDGRILRYRPAERGDRPAAGICIGQTTTE